MLSYSLCPLCLEWFLPLARQQDCINENKQQISINSDQYFAGIPPQIWNFYIGGYQVCQKWLKDRKGRHLSYDDLEHYQQIISILGESIAVMETIDIIINKYGGFPFS